jgi:AcrR family transcriptional regulator
MGKRQDTRDRIERRIIELGRRHLITDGAAGLSLRAIARDLHMASSALYRYFASRDDLLTALVIDPYNALGEAAETALARHAKQPPLARWVAVCRSARRWALAHPHAYALIYGTPVPGYHAPANTVAPASRVGLALAGVVADAGRSGLLGAPTGTVPESLGRDADRLAAELGVDLPREVVAGLVAAWSQLFGLVSFELFGQFENMISARGQFFDRAVERLAESIGFAVPAP